MGTLNDIKPDTTFFDLEDLLIDATNMADVLSALVSDIFGENEIDGRYNLSADAVRRMFFISGMLADMTRKTRDAYYVAWENERPSKQKAA